MDRRELTGLCHHCCHDHCSCSFRKLPPFTLERQKGKPMSRNNCEESVDVPDTLMGCWGPQFEKHWDSGEDTGFWSQRPGVKGQTPPHQVIV